MPELFTTLGRLSLDHLAPGVILPHEHVLVDLRLPSHPDHGRALVDDVVKLMAPELARARQAGVAALVECTPLGVGRRVDADLAASVASGVPVVVPTGVYREPWVPAWVKVASEASLADWMVRELMEGVDDTGVVAGWIKLSAGDDGMTDCERKILRAAAQAGAATGALIGSHTIQGRVLMEQLDVVEAAGYTAERFIWIHTQAEPDSAMHLAAARRGAWIEYDAIGGGLPDAAFVAMVLRVLEAGYGHRLLLSHDRGWFDPAKPNGGKPRPFDYLTTVFLPTLAAAGVASATIEALTRMNPFRAFARQDSRSLGPCARAARPSGARQSQRREYG